MLIAPRKISALLKHVSGGGADANIDNITGSFRNKPMINVMRSIPKRQRKNFYFYDIGAANGYALLCALALGFKKARGCELPVNKPVQGRIFKGAKRILENALTKKLDAKIIFKEFRHIPSEANVVYVFNAVFIPALQEMIMAKVKRSNAQYFICTKSRLFSDQDKILNALDRKFEFLKEIRGYMIGSSSQHRIWVFKRL
jgi:hypothetical protein